MLYDVPARTGLAMTEATLVELAAHPRILAIKDAKGDLFEAMSVMARTPLAYYCGVEAGVLPHPAVRLPLLPASPDDVRRLREALTEHVVPV